MPPHQEKLDSFVEGFASKAGELTDTRYLADSSRQRCHVRIREDGIFNDSVLIIQYGTTETHGTLSPSILEEATGAEIICGAQVLYEMPIETFRVDYFRQAFSELERQMQSGQRGEAELIETDVVLAMRINRSVALNFKKSRGAFRKAGAQFGAQIRRDVTRLMKYSALPV
ncbi:MAG: hypothetical protein MRY72_00395 [Aquisalinus sp.]|nr:hypothetical protein [Aquisalinus sp.]